MMELEACIGPECRYKGYLDTKKCWYHSLGLPLPTAYIDSTVETNPMTFEEALEGMSIDEAIAWTNRNHGD